MIIKRNRQQYREVKKTSKQLDVAEKQPQANSELKLTAPADIAISESEVQKQEINSLPPEPDIELFDIENIDFDQRVERRRGSRRRGYRRIDDRNLVSRAQEDAENIKKSAFEEGYSKGVEQAKADLEVFRGNIQVFMNSSKEVFEYIAPDILEISVDIAKKIVKKELETDPQVLINTIIEVLKKTSKNEPKINIRVRPEDVQFVKDTVPNITYQYGLDAKINIVADSSLQDGGCIFQTNNGIVDASIDTQLEIIKKSLEGI